MSSDLSAIWKDLRRRRVFQVAAIYAASAWVIVQVADVIGPAIGMWPWVMTAIVGFAMVGFPIAVILAWLFDVGPGGVVRTKPGSATGILAIVISLGLLGAGTAGFVWIIKPGEPPGQVDLDFEPVANSVAVMPFIDLSPGNDSEHLSDGIAQVLIHQLSMIAKLKVIASESSFAFKGEDIDNRTIAQKLRAERLLVGSVQRSGDRLRIATQLIDSSTGESVWSELFDREGKDIFAIQDEIALAVADRMDAPFEPDVRDRATGPLSDDLDAYDLYLLAQHEARKTTIDDGSRGERVIELLEEAIEKDPEFALAWGFLASRVYFHGVRGHLPYSEALRLSREYLAKALELDPELSEAHSWAAYIAGEDDDLEAARQSFEKAVHYGPSNWTAYLYFGLALNRQGRFAEAVDVLLKGLDRNPYRPEYWLRLNLGDAYIALGEYDKGMQQHAANYVENKGGDLEGQPIVKLGLAAFGAQRYDEAAAVLEIARRDGHEAAMIPAFLANSLLAIGDIDAAADEIARAETMMAEERASGRVNNWDLAVIEDVRWLHDIATGDLKSQLLQAKRHIEIADAVEEDSSSVQALYQAAIRCVVLGRYEDAARMMDRLTLEARHPEIFALAAFAHQKLGQAEESEHYRKEGRVVVDEFMKDRDPEYPILTSVALFQAVDRQADEAIVMLQRAYALGLRDHAYLVYMPLFDPVRNDPRFTELVHKMRADTQQMRLRVAEARKSGDWESIIARHFEN